MKTKQVLIQIRQLLSKRGAWIKSDIAIVPGGIKTWPNNPDAIGWCLVGAIEKIIGVADTYKICNILKADDHVNNVPLHMYNDNKLTRKKDILSLLDRTIAKYK